MALKTTLRIDTSMATPHFFPSTASAYANTNKQSSNGTAATFSQVARFVGRQRLYKVLLVVVAAVVAVNSLCA
ncbi:hypothetical protein Gpo141_00009121, partial [Globisporangium polare]